MSVIKITKDNFETEVLADSQTVLLDFWAPWCGPCRMLSPVLEILSGEQDGKVKIGKINVDEETELATQFRVMTIPMLVVVKNGEAVRSAAGLQTKKEIVAMLEE